MSDWLGRTYKFHSLEFHSDFFHHFFQRDCYFRFCCFLVKTCHHCFTDPTRQFANSCVVTWMSLRVHTLLVVVAWCPSLQNFAIGSDCVGMSISVCFFRFVRFLCVTEFANLPCGSPTKCLLPLSNILPFVRVVIDARAYNMSFMTWSPFLFRLNIKSSLWMTANRKMMCRCGDVMLSDCRTRQCSETLIRNQQWNWQSVSWKMLDCWNSMHSV